MQGKIRRAARQRLGYRTLRPGQLEAVEGLLAGRDVLAILPSGYGKSAIYHLAGLFLRGPSIVVSPMIALQLDQMQSIDERDPGQAAQFNSAISAAERREALDDVEEGEVEFLLLTPEQLAKEEVRDQLRANSPSLFVVDEAHCISEWGHDFRPEYLQLGQALEALGRPRVLALTATASPPVRQEIASELRMRDPLVVVRGFDRPNIWLGSTRYLEEKDKLTALLDEVESAERPGIVYAATRRNTEEVAEALRERGIDASHYHAGMNGVDREDVQSAFMEDRLDVIVATNAFGMGVDKPNVRFVFHHDVPGSLDAYYQEIGRGGRDGAPTFARLFYRTEDLGVQRFLATTGRSGDGGHEREKRREAFERSQLEMMRGYAETSDCRREFLLTYFGEDFRGPCGNCDNCEAGSVVARKTRDDRFPAGSRVRHAEWGEGVVQRNTDDTLVVLFDQAGYRTLATELVEEKELLERLP